MFANAVLIARNGSVLVETAALEIGKVDGSLKNFPVNVVHVGEKVRATGVIAEHFFYSTSPLDFIPSDVPRRVLYRGEFRDYAAAAQENWTAFEKWLATYKAENGLGFAPIADKDEGAKIIKDVEPHVREHVERMLAGDQREAGEYRLTLRIRYYDPSYPLRWRREASSSISFKIGSDLKERLRQQAITTMMSWSIASITGSTPNVTYPEYQPLDIREL